VVASFGDEKGVTKSVPVVVIKSKSHRRGTNYVLGIKNNKMNVVIDMSHTNLLRCSYPGWWGLVDIYS
jgi:hypothetical protein